MSKLNQGAIGVGHIGEALNADPSFWIRRPPKSIVLTTQMTSNSSLLLPDWSPVEPSISQDSQITIKPRDFQSHSLATTGIEPQQKSVHIDDVMELDDDEEAGSTEDSECTSRFSDDSDEEEEEVKKVSLLWLPLSTLLRDD